MLKELEIAKAKVDVINTIEHPVKVNVPVVSNDVKTAVNFQENADVRFSDVSTTAVNVESSNSNANVCNPPLTRSYDHDSASLHVPRQQLNCDAPEFVPSVRSQQFHYPVSANGYNVVHESQVNQAASKSFQTSNCDLNVDYPELPRSVPGNQVSDQNFVNTQSNVNTHGISELMKSFGEFISVSRLPVPEPGVYWRPLRISFLEECI
jgi:hypothetical protein